MKKCEMTHYFVYDRFVLPFSLSSLTHATPHSNRKKTELRVRRGKTTGKIGKLPHNLLSLAFVEAFSGQLTILHQRCLNTFLILLNVVSLLLQLLQ